MIAAIPPSPPPRGSIALETQLSNQNRPGAAVTAGGEPRLAAQQPRSRRTSITAIGPEAAPQSMSLTASQQDHQNSTIGPTAPWLAAGLLLAGLGTVLLGPILPALSRNWNLTDAQSGTLLLAKFIGAFLGGVSVPRRLRLGILSGTILGALGFGAFALSIGLVTGTASLFVAGVGIGQIIASTNILAGRRYSHHTGSALSAINFFFSLGAVSTGLLAAALFPRFPLREPILSFAAIFLIVSLGGYFNRAADHGPAPTEAPTTPLPRAMLVHFALLLFLYGGLETCLAAWLTTFAQRYSDAAVLDGQTPVVLLFFALTVGRALSSAALRYFPEAFVQRLGLIFSAIFVAALAIASHGATISLLSILLGLALAPFFPATFGILMKRAPTAREAGFILAVSGLGAALFSWLMGVISTHANSLRLAMTIPFGLALVMFLLSFTRTAAQSSAPTEAQIPAIAP